MYIERFTSLCAGERKRACHAYIQCRNIVKSHVPYLLYMCKHELWNGREACERNERISTKRREKREIIENCLCRCQTTKHSANIRRSSTTQSHFVVKIALVHVYIVCILAIYIWHCFFLFCFSFIWICVVGWFVLANCASCKETCSIRVSKINNFLDIFSVLFRFAFVSMAFYPYSAQVKT